MCAFRLTTFRAEVTPPVGHPLCAGWMPPALGITDSLFADGVVLVGDKGSTPLVLCAIDWCEISNRSYERWRRVLADAVGTTPERVSVHCVHPHCTPWPDEYAQKLVDEFSDVRPIMDTRWCEQALENTAHAAHAAMSETRAVTHLTIGRAQVEQVASNRRIMGDDGKIKAVRWTRTLDAEVRGEPEGLIDPWLKTISFWNGDTKLAALHYYAVHPSSYEDCYVTPDFTGLARERRRAEDGVPHLYFTECAGNITAGKYNDGAHELREVFTERIHRAMVESEHAPQRINADEFEWRTAQVSLPPRDDRPNSDEKALQDSSLESVYRGQAALVLAYREREQTPITIGALHFGNECSILHLPGESFIEYQLFAQAQRPSALVAVPSYGDCGPGYICMESSFAEGGYEPQDSFVAPESEHVLKQAIVEVMSSHDDA
jgi:hypothetical protein